MFDEKHVLNHGYEEHAEQRAPRGAATTLQAGTAENAGGDRAQFLAHAHGAARGREARGVDDASQPGEESDQRERNNLQAFDVDAAEVRRLRIRADVVELPKEARMGEAIMSHRAEKDDQPDRSLQAEELRLAELGERGGRKVMPGPPTRAVPGNIPKVPKVVSRAVGCTLATATPLANPPRAASAGPPAIAAGTGHPACFMSQPVTTPTSEAVAPTLRSKVPPINISIMPSARMHSNAMLRTTDAKLSNVANRSQETGNSTRNTTRMRTSNRKTPVSRVGTKRRRRWGSMGIGQFLPSRAASRITISSFAPSPLTSPAMRPPRIT